ncbi:MAG: aspartate/glutamate racemase family protein [Hyphomicrobiaceae bacterium]
MIKTETVTAEFDNGIASRAALGVVVLQTDETLEPELRSVLGDKGVALYHSRIPNSDDVTPETLHAMAAEMPRALGLLPVARPLDVVAYGCTSASTVIGQDKVAEMIRAAHPMAASTDPISAVVAACRHLGVKRLGLLTPYTLDVSARMQALLEGAGIEIAAFASFEQASDALVARTSPRSVREGIGAVARSADVDAVFASCTNLQTFSILDAAEADIGKPVISSNAALAWDMRQKAGLGPSAAGPGRLLRSQG